jgi:glycosyltransferase involved in cell wall biosynthesis
MAGGMGASREALALARQAGFPASKPLERVFWGVSTEIFRPMDSTALSERLGLDGKRVAGFVGRLAPEKGLNVFLSALRKLPPNVHGLIIGDGPLRAEVGLLCGSPEWAGRLHLCPPMPQELLAQHMNCMDALAAPSLTTPHWKEQYGRVIAEAMACGVPVIGSDCGAIPEVIGPAGIVVREGDADAWAQAMDRLLASDSERARLREEGLRRARQELSAAAMAARMLAFYQ